MIKTVVEFIEPTCPFCRYVYIHILRDIMVRRTILNQKLHQQKSKKIIPPFDVKLVDITANRGSLEEQWFNWYSRKIGGRYTPVVKINDTGFYLWGGDKPEKIGAETLSRTDKLKSEILAELTDEYFEKEPVLYDNILMDSIRGLYI
jgi:glutaredoxin